MKAALNCSQIPYFVLLKQNGQMVTNNGYALVNQIGVGLFEYLDYSEFGGKEKVQRQMKQDTIDSYHSPSVYKDWEEFYGNKGADTSNAGVVNELKVHAFMI